MAAGNYFSAASDLYKQYRPTYPEALYQYLAGLAPSRRLAWDCGCGNGQASVVLAKYFQQVRANDISPEQIAEAQPADNVTYHVSAGEEINAENNSIDLVTIAQAIHWFKHDSFFREVDRVLKPNGVLAAWGYQLMYSDSPLDAVIERLHGDIVGPYWPKGREYLDEGYSQITFPYARIESPPFSMQCEWQLAHLIGYLNTWSAVKAYTQAHQQNPIDLVLNDIENCWGDPEQSRFIYWPLILYVGKKSP